MFRLFVKFRLDLIAQTYTHAQKFDIGFFRIKVLGFGLTSLYFGSVNKNSQKQVHVALYVYWILPIHIGTSNEFEKLVLYLHKFWKKLSFN